MAGFGQLFPRTPRPNNGFRVGTVENQDDAIIQLNIDRLGTISKKPHTGLVGVIVACRDPDRLLGRPTIVGRPMRLERFVAIAPQMGVQRVASLLRTHLHNAPPGPFKALLQ